MNIRVFKQLKFPWIFNWTNSVRLQLFAVLIFKLPFAAIVSVFLMSASCTHSLVAYPKSFSYSIAFHYAAILFAQHNFDRLLILHLM